MPTDPAELILFGEMSPDRFFREAEELGIPAEDLKDEQTHNRVLHRCLIRVRSNTAQAVAAELDMPITDEQARAIAQNSLTPDVMAEPAPLDRETRRIATELYYHAVKAAVTRQGNVIKDRTARAEAQRMVAAGERGLTGLQRFCRASGCLLVFGVLGLGAASALAAVAAAIIAAVPSI